MVPSRARETHVSFHLLVVVNLLAGAPHPTSEVESCENAKTRAPREHLRVCAALFADPTCRRAFLPSDQPMSFPHLDEMAEACAPTTCPRLEGIHREEPFCRGVRGTPASSFSVEGSLIEATLVLDQPAEPKAAWSALLRALSRVASEAQELTRAAQAKQLAAARLRVSILGAASGVKMEIASSAGLPTAEFSGEHGTPEACARLVTKALGSRPVLPQDEVVILAQRTALFSDIKCITRELEKAGFGQGNIVFRAVH